MTFEKVGAGTAWPWECGTVDIEILRYGDMEILPHVEPSLGKTERHVARWPADIIQRD